MSRTANADNKESLQTGRIIDRDSGDPSKPVGTLIDIGLSTTPENGLVDLICILDQNAPFVVYDPNDPVNTIGKETLEVKNSNGIIGVFAETDAETHGNGDEMYSLSVQIKQTFKGEPFSNPQRPFLIPLILPRQNRVDLIVNLGEKQTAVVAPDSKYAIRPWPNQPMPFSVLPSPTTGTKKEP